MRFSQLQRIVGSCSNFLVLVVNAASSKNTFMTWLHVLLTCMCSW